MRILPIWCAFATLVAAKSLAAPLTVSATGVLTVGQDTLPFSTGTLVQHVNSVHELSTADGLARASVAYFHHLRTWHNLRVATGDMISTGEPTISEGEFTFSLPEGALYGLYTTLRDMPNENLVSVEFAMNGEWVEITPDAPHLSNFYHHGQLGAGDHTFAWRFSTTDTSVEPSVLMNLRLNTVPEPATVGGALAALALLAVFCRQQGHAQTEGGYHALDTDSRGLPVGG